MLTTYPGGTDTPASKNRVAKFTEQVRGMGVEIVDTIPQLLEKVDVVLLESVDGVSIFSSSSTRFPPSWDRVARLFRE